MGRIRLLPEHVISQIAAGEVIQRPASVVKELIENSLDAKATKIEIALVDGGLKSVSVRDNGCGMSPEDLRLSVERHATSKILDTEDLFRISTFGFRGEALASIRAVSKLTIVTREEGAETGYLLHVEGMNPIHLEPVGTIQGTHVEVQDLFFNTPVRRKFLKGANAEFKYILEWVVRFGFAHPQKRFSLNKDGQRFLT
ncbi:MAG: DNA mismatch repair endonuclease MutL [Desulfatiglandales bacterium]